VEEAVGDGVGLAAVADEEAVAAAFETVAGPVVALAPAQPAAARATASAAAVVVMVRMNLIGGASPRVEPGR
jgi:hypothetical protein